MKYNALTRHYFEATAAAGILEGPGVGRGASGSRALGTWVQFDVAAARGRVVAVRFLAFGCPHTIAISAWVAESAVGGVLEPSLPADIESLREQFAVPVEKLGRLLTVEDAWSAAVVAARALAGAPEG